MNIDVNGGADMTCNEVAVICKAMSDANRLSILEMLTRGEQCACRILEQHRITQPTLSHHMKVLSDCGLVTTRKEGKWSYYTINCGRFREFKDYIAGITCTAAKEDTGKTCCCK